MIPIIDLSKNYFYVKNADGELVRHNVVISFKCESSGNTYILHSDNIKDENGRIRAYLSLYNEKVYGDRLVEVKDKAEYETELEKHFEGLSKRKGVNKR